MRRALWEAMRRQRQAGEPAAPPPEGKTYRRKPGPRPRPESRKPSLPARKKTAPAPAVHASPGPLAPNRPPDPPEAPAALRLPYWARKGGR